MATPDRSLLLHAGRRAVACALLPLLGACYRTAPVDLAALPEGASARFVLSGEAVERMRRDPAQAALLDDFAITGELARRAADSLTIAIVTRNVEAGAITRSVRRELRLAPLEVRSVQQRTLDKRRTRLMAISLAAGTAVASSLIVYSGGRSTGNSGRPVDGTEQRIPLWFRVALPR
jgi:hypothetical protein